MNVIIDDLSKRIIILTAVLALAYDYCTYARYNNACK